MLLRSHPVAPFAGAIVVNHPLAQGMTIRGAACQRATRRSERRASMQKATYTRHCRT
jgi:hypothetical protein